MCFFKTILKVFMLLFLCCLQVTFVSCSTASRVIKEPVFNSKEQCLETLSAGCDLSCELVKKTPTMNLVPESTTRKFCVEVCKLLIHKFCDRYKKNLLVEKGK